MPGYIKLHRDVQRHWLYEEKRVFSKYEAWLDILMRVNHTDGKVTHNGTVEVVVRGSTIWSMGDMERHWGWSNKKVKRFLICLVDDQMLSVKSTTKKTYLTVMNYDFYQDNKREEAPPMHQEGITEAYQKHTNKNVKNVKNEKEDIYTIFNFWNSKKITVHRELTDATKGAINARLNVHSTDSLLGAIDNYNTCLIGEEYFYSYKFTLKEFMNPKNVDKFLTENEPFKNFRDKSKKPQGKPDEEEFLKRLEEMDRAKRSDS